jgi:hypothetical protein
MDIGVYTRHKWVGELKSERSRELTIGKPITEEKREIVALKNRTNG